MSANPVWGEDNAVSQGLAGVLLLLALTFAEGKVDNFYYEQNANRIMVAF